jgi:hypothetical protein
VKLSNPIDNEADEQGIADLEHETEVLIDDNIRDMLHKSQQVYDSDILDFNDMLCNALDPD